MGYICRAFGDYSAVSPTPEEDSRKRDFPRGRHQGCSGHEQAGKKRIRPGSSRSPVPVYETFSKTVYKGTYSSSRYGKISPSIDYLNEEHKEWFLPWDNRTPQTESAYELFEKGIDDAAALIEKVAHGFGGELGDLQVQEILGNDSMLTGVAWNAPFLPRYYDCVYKQEEAKIAEKAQKAGGDSPEKRINSISKNLLFEKREEFDTARQPLTRDMHPKR